MAKYIVSGSDGDFVITGESVRVAYTDAVANGEIYGRKDLTEMPDIIAELNNSGVLDVCDKPTDRRLTRTIR
ncbi:MAG: hypothetical protein CMB80_01720 [Flammeovirgaceae bacterium]|nr:hypothetical protein [Flammeovirgaceae bacterium]